MSQTLSEIVIQCHLDSLSWFPDDARELMTHAAYTMVEVGEFMGLVKKCDRDQLEFTDLQVREDMVMELADAFTHLMNCFAILNVDPEQAYNIKRGRNIERWGEPNHEAAIERARSGVDGQQSGS